MKHLNNKNNVLVIVDGYSSGAKLPTAVAEYGWECVHVRALPKPPDYFLTTFRENDYTDKFIFEGDLHALTQAISKIKPLAVLPGSESGVVVADQLAAELSLPGNDPLTSNARRDKYEMTKRIKAHKLHAPDHYLAKHFIQLLEWANSGAWPVVLKPPASAGTDSVLFCENANELKMGFQQLYGNLNQLGQRNYAVLAQRLLVGQEYFINGISGYGQHIISEIWRADKIRVPGAGLIYDRSVLIDPGEPAIQPLVNYVHQVLDTLGICYGASHTEIMVTDQGPTLIECASRPSGGINRAAANYAVGASQIDLLAKLVAKGRLFIENLSHRVRDLMHFPLWQVQLMASQTGRVTQAFTHQLLKILRSKVWLQKVPQPGDMVQKTIDLFSSPGIIFLSHESSDVLQRDYEIIREWEKNNKLFTVRPIE